MRSLLAWVARGAPQGRLPELEELQRQLTAAHEQLSDLQFSSSAERERAALALREAQEQGDALRGELQAAEGALGAARQQVEAGRAEAGALQQQLDQAVELYTAVQGERGCNFIKRG